MSKILRRPMFRGGPVDSRGTGITSGLMDGGRVGLNTGGDLILGGQLNPNLRNLNKMNSYIPVGQIEEIETETDDRGFLQKFYDTLNPSKETIENRLTEQDEATTTFDEKMENIGIVTNEQKQKIADEAAAKATVGGREDPDVENARIQQENYEKNKKSQLEQILSGSTEESTEASMDDIKAQAERFREILGADNKKKLKDARIGDASDYLLKFFEGSQREGATVGSAAADVAGFATSKDSKTERAKAAIEKTDQTASALAINDYISGKKSKAEIAKMMKLAEYRSDLAAERGKKNVGEYIMSSKELGFSNKVKEGVQAKYGPRVFEEVTSEIMSDSTKFQPDESDVGKVYIETDTKTVYTFDEKGNKRQIYQG